MDKFAQDRSILNKLREKLNVPGAMVEGFFKPELDRIMNDLRLADDNIRTILTGQKIGKADTEFTAGKSVKELLKSARSNFNRREYMAGVAELGEFHKRLFDVTRYTSKLDMSVNRIHHNFLFQNLDDKQKENMQGLKNYMSKASEVSIEEYFIKEASIMDFFYNIGTKRGRALAIWEKKYPNVVKDLRDGGIRLLDMADSILADLLSLLKDMATARATRKVDDYMAATKKIEKEYAKFDGGDKGFRAYYTNVILPYFKRQEQFEAEESAKTGPQQANQSAQEPTQDVAEENIPIPLVNQTSAPTQHPPAAATFSPEEEPTDPNMTVPPVPAPAPTPEVTPLQEQLPHRGPLPIPTAHQKFYQSLETLSNEHPLILAKYISKYATLIQSSDPQTAIELFNVVRKIK